MSLEEGDESEQCYIMSLFAGKKYNSISNISLAGTLQRQQAQAQDFYLPYIFASDRTTANHSTARDCSHHNGSLCATVPYCDTNNQVNRSRHMVFGGRKYECHQPTRIRLNCCRSSSLNL